MHAVLISLVLGASASLGATPASIDGLCDPLTKYAQRSKNVPVIFADVSDPQTDKNARWLRVKDKDELDRRAKNAGLYTQAFVWRQERGTFVSIFFTSPSGDWGEYVDHCFRQDGSLARSEATLNTFNAYREDEPDAPVSRIRTRYFDSAGRLIRSRKRVVDIKTRKPLKVAFDDEEETIFRSVEKLPFAGLLP
jgi:hypothetical protein